MVNEVPGKAKEINFEFILEATEQGEKLLDAYVGVEFSVIVSPYSSDHFLFSTKSQPRYLEELIQSKSTHLFM